MEEYRFSRLTDPEADAGICMEAFVDEIERHLADAALPTAHREVLEQLLDYGDSLLA